MGRIYVGCATWAIGTANDHLLPDVPGGNLARYAARLTAAEVNSSFHRRHQHANLGPVGAELVQLPPSLAFDANVFDAFHERLAGRPVLRLARHLPLAVRRRVHRGSLAARLSPGDWCIFDNTASGAALPNAVELRERLAARLSPS